MSLKAFWGNLGADNDAVFAKKRESAARKLARAFIWRRKRSAEKKPGQYPRSATALRLAITDVR